MPFCRCPGLHDWLLKAYRRNKIPEAHHFPPFPVSTLLAKKWSLWNSLLPARPRHKDDLAGTCLSCQLLKCPNYCDVGIEKANLPLLMGKRTGNEVGVWTSGKKGPSPGQNSSDQTGPAFRTMRMLRGWSVDAGQGWAHFLPRTELCT